MKLGAHCQNEISEFVNGIAAGLGIQMSAGAGIKNSCSSFSCTHWSAKEMDQNRETTVSLTSKGEDFGKAKGESREI